MSNGSIAEYPGIGALAEQISGELGDDPHLAGLTLQFLQTPRYQRAFCLELIDIARAPHRHSWALRRLTILMLEHQLLKVQASDYEELIFLLSALGVAVPAQADDARAWFLRLRRRLERLNRVHLAIAGEQTSIAAMADFIEASRSECKLTLGRYLFTPAEVVDRIVRGLDLSKGVCDVQALDQPYVRHESERLLEHLPAFEAAILAGLCRSSAIYWVSARTGSRHNSLVEYPLGTVVAVVKPPGSDLEIELKRVGLRGRYRWHVVFTRDGEEVPPTHRLQGGSMGHWARWEAASAAGLARVYRLVHGSEAPISRSVSVSRIYSVPVDGGEQHVVNYFLRLEGPAGRDETRRAMRRSIHAYSREMRTRPLPYDSDIELAAQFLGQTAPTQAILAGTSSFRLDRLAEQLSSDGADRYFTQTSAGRPSRAEAKAFADELLEEVLGVVTPPDTRFETCAQYVADAYAVPDNRARAERHYLATMRQVGFFWGTLLGMRAHTYGESFVARNVGLKSVWQGGEWIVKVIFMDHDGTYISGQRAGDFRPLSALPAMIGDDLHIWGSKAIQGDVELLTTIYRIDEQSERRARIALREAIQDAFERTHRAICEDPGVQDCFARAFVDRYPDWDEMVIEYLALNGNDPAAADAWAARTSASLDEKGYPARLRREYVRAVPEHRDFLEKYAFLYRGRLQLAAV